MNNIEAFNLITGKLFAQLYQGFPSYVEIDYHSLCLDLMPKDDYSKAWDMPKFAEATVQWLSEADYIWLNPPPTIGAKYSAVLTPKALEVLKAIPDALDGKRPLGERIVEFAKGKLNESLSEAVSLAISEGVKLLIKGT